MHAPHLFNIQVNDGTVFQTLHFVVHLALPVFLKAGEVGVSDELILKPEGP